MILVDTSVWIDFLRGHLNDPVLSMRGSLLTGEEVCICGVILTEVLQGIRDERNYLKTHALLEKMTYLPMGKESFLFTARIYRILRRHSLTIRKPVNCMIAAVALEYDIPLLHNDRDFEPIAKYCHLKTR